MLLLSGACKAKIAQKNARALRQLALSGYDYSGDAHASLEHGFDHHLVKPVDPDQLARLISEKEDVTDWVSWFATSVKPLLRLLMATALSAESKNYKFVT